MSLKVPPQIATGFGDQLQDAFERWLFYRAGKIEAFKNQELQYLVLTIRAHAKRHGEKAVADLIHKSIDAEAERLTFDFDTDGAIYKMGTRDRRGNLTRFV